MDFRTERLTAERLAAGHLADLTALHLDPEVSRFLGGVRSPAQTEAYLAANLAHWERHGHGLWVVRTADGGFAGRVGLRYIDVEGVAEMEIAYTLRRDLWRQGLASEAARALVAIWRARRLSPSLIGVASPANTGSRRVLEKAGLGYERDAVYHGEAVALYRMVLDPA
jgi:RimJ/RimL family protein N-acetyltransferase